MATIKSARNTKSQIPSFGTVKMLKLQLQQPDVCLLGNPIYHCDVNKRALQPTTPP